MHLLKISTLIITLISGFPISVKAQKLNKLFCEYEKTMGGGFAGVMIYEPSTQKTWLKKNHEKLFIPASNVKILTLYACLKTLGDSLEAVRYIKQNDTLFIWGTADPTLLHPDFPASQTLGFLNSDKHKTIAFSKANYKGPQYGSGWAWDDYNDYYQTELSALPIYGNIVRFKTMNGELEYSPKSQLLSVNNTLENSSIKIKRAVSENTFNVNFNLIKNNTAFSLDIPFIVNNQTQLLSEAIGEEIKLIDKALPLQFQVLHSQPVDTVYRRMMQISDNMLAEHLLLLAGNKLSPEMSTEMSIANLSERYFSFLPNQIKWIDGSGLSRYNLLSPESLVAILDKMITEFPKEKIFSYLASTNTEGTLKNTYKKNPIPYVFAKSGSMGAVYNQSGYIITKKGKLLIFSIMNNNFLGGFSYQKNKVTEFINVLYEKY